MKKLFDLKEFLTIPEASRYLSSIVFGEEVKDEDVLRLALDGHLQLSVELVNGATGRSGKMLLVEMVDGKDRKPPYPRTVIKATGSPPPNGSFVFDGKIVHLTGVKDLCLVGNPRSIVANKYHELSGGPIVRKNFRRMVVVASIDGMDVWQIQESLDEDENVTGSIANLAKLKQDAAGNNAFASNPSDRTAQILEYRGNFLSKPLEERYRPAPTLPSDCVLVVRTAMLKEFEKRLRGHQDNEKPLLATERKNLLKLVIGMAMGGYAYNPSASKNDAIAEIVRDLDLFNVGLTDDTVRKYLKEAIGTVLDQSDSDRNKNKPKR
jgi:hypothetical protein